MLTLACVHVSKRTHTQANSRMHLHTNTYKHAHMHTHAHKHVRFCCSRTCKLTHSHPTHTGGCRGGGCGGTGCGYDKNTCTYSRTPSLPTQVAAGAAAVVAQAVVTMKTHVHTHTLSPYPHKWLWGRWQWWHRLQIRCIHKYILTHSLPTHTGGCGGGGIGGTGYRYDAFTSTYSHTPSLFAQVAAGVVAVVARAVDTVHKGV